MPEKRKKALEPELVEIGARIRAARMDRGMTREQLAEAADTSTQFLAKIEKGEQSMTVGKFAKLARALGVSGDFLLYGGEKTNRRVSLAAEYMGRLTEERRDALAQTIIDLQGLLEELGSKGE